MKILSFYIFFILFKTILNEYKSVKLIYSEPYYFIPVKLGNNTNNIDFIFSNIIPIDFVPSTKCEICTNFKLNETNSNLVSIKQDIKIPYYHNNFTGNIYKNIISIDNLINEIKFIGFNHITYKSKFSQNGIFSLSYLNYDFNTTKKIFALKFTESNCELHLGGYDQNFISNHSNLKSFYVTLENNNSIDQIYKSIWYIKFSSIYISNITSKKQFKKQENPIKLSFDIGTDKLHIPKKFFFDNIKLIFPEKSQCQIHPEGYFICQCGENYRTNFGNFSFENENGAFCITPTDYISYEPGISGGTCIARIKINYENDIFIAGIPVLKNYYSIFDVDSKIFMIYKETKDEIFENVEFFIMFMFCIALIEMLIFGIYFCRKKCNANNNLNNNNDEPQEVLNHQNESSEETD